MPIVKCHFCEAELNVNYLDDLKRMNLARIISKMTYMNKNRIFNEIKDIQWKYICSDCAATDRYQEWIKTEDANWHMAVALKCKVKENDVQGNDEQFVHH